MKKMKILMLMLTVSVLASAQKMTIKTVNGQVVEISCEGGLKPQAVSVAADGTVTFKMNEAETVAEANKEIAEEKTDVEADSVDTLEAVDSLETPATAEEVALTADSLSSVPQSGIGFLAESIAGELSPEYAPFVKKHEGMHPGTEGALVKKLATNIVGEEAVETVGFLGTLFGNLRFTKDSTFVP